MDSIASVLADLREKAKSRQSTQALMTSQAGKESNKAERLEAAGIHRRFQWVTFEAIDSKGLPTEMTIRSNYAQIKGYADRLEENIKAGVGLLMMGDYGLMKTTMAVAVLRRWLDMGHGGMMVPMCSLLDNLYTMRTLNKEEWAKYEQRLRSIPLLVLDDLGGENTDQSWVLSKVDSIITERYNKTLPVIATTNLSKSELMGTYSGRIMDRLRATSKILTFKGKSQRESVK